MVEGVGMIETAGVPGVTGIVAVTLGVSASSTTSEAVPSV